MGDIGKEQREVEFVPLPADEPVHEPAPEKEPEKVPA